MSWWGFVPGAPRGPALGVAISRASWSRDTGAVSDGFRLGELTVVDDVDAGDWIVKNTHDWGLVRALVPETFQAYARVFHPAYRWVEDPQDAGALAPTMGRLIPGTNRAVTLYGREVGWAEVAAANGRVAHPAMEWESITGERRFRPNGEQPGLWDQTPELATLPLRHTQRLCELLAGHTSTPERCWFAIWEGYGDLPAPLRELDVPRLEMKHRAMIVLTGPLSALPATSFDEDSYIPGWMNHADGYKSPSLWWPQDRSWCVASDVDLQSTYLGATAECVGQLIDDGELKISEVAADQSVAMDADLINPEPLGEYGD